MHLKYLATIALLIFSAHAMSFELEKDKKLHVGVSAIISSGSYFSHQSLSYNFTESLDPQSSALFSMAVCLTAGTAKELFDEINGGRLDNNDMIANLAGCSIGTLSAHLFNSTIMISPGINSKGEIMGITLSKAL